MDDVLGVEPWRLPHDAAVALADNDSPSIARLGASTNVRRMTRRVIPMICH